MSDPLYREIILEHFRHPQNWGIVKKADIDVTELNPVCGDEIRITAKTQNSKVEEISFTAQGCAVSKAGGSIYTEMVKGRTIKEIKEMKPEELLEQLDAKLSPARLKCALLAFSTFKKALK